MDVLEKLFGSGVRVKVLRFFLMNPDLPFTIGEVCRFAKVSKNNADKELAFLQKLGFIRSAKKGKEKGFQSNNLFQYHRALRYLIVDSSPISREILLKHFKELGRGLKFVALLGVFVGEDSVNGEGLDVLMVGDNIKNRKLKKVLGRVESEIGRELKYVLFDTNEFKYRHSMYDKFVIDILDNAHDVLIDGLKA